MITTSVNEDNDVYLGADGNLAMVRNIQATMQTAEHFAKAARGEMIHKMDEGMPFMQTVFARDASVPQFEAALRKRLLAAPNVKSIIELITVQEDDVLRYTATIETIYGAVNING